MQNQGSPAQLLFPTVPSNYCPEGTWSDVLNSFTQLYLNNGTVNIPGLGLVTPQQIQSLQQAIQSLQNQFNAIAFPVYDTGIVAISGNPVEQLSNITFNKVMPNTNYLVSITPIVASGTSSIQYHWSWGVVDGSKNTTGMSVFVFSNANTVNVTSFQWYVVSYPS